MKSVFRIFIWVAVIGLVSCSESDDGMVIRGKWAPKSAMVDMKAKPESEKMVDAIVTQLGGALGMPVTSLSQLNAILSALLTQSWMLGVESVEFVSSSELVLTPVGEKAITTQYTIRDNRITFKLPAEASEMPVPIPLQLKYSMENGELKFYIDQELINEIITSPLFDLLISMIQKENEEEIITAEQIRSFFGMMQQVDAFISMKSL